MTSQKQKSINKENPVKTELFSSVKLTSDQLRWACPDKIFKFKTTASIEPLEEIIGQHRAMEAIKTNIFFILVQK